MPQIISFQDAIAATNGEERVLLIGNGFSSPYFNYRNLLAEANLDEGGPIKALFDKLETVDFEVVIRALEDASVVERAYGNDTTADQFEGDSQVVREALVAAVNATHPAHREHLEDKYKDASAFLANFNTVFSLNYDLLLYWVNLEKRLLNDGFGLGKDTADGQFKGPFHENAYCHIFNLHGGLHLFSDDYGMVHKALSHGDGVIATITHQIAVNRRLPLYVAEGNSKSKLRKINSSGYLRHCYRSLQETASSVFVFGHSADANDAHIYHAMFGSRAKHVWFGIYQPDDDKIRTLDAKLAGYQKLGGDKVAYDFFDSQSARVWDGEVQGDNYAGR